MAPKKGTINNSDFLKQVQQTAKKEAQAVDIAQSQQYQDFVGSIDKQSQLIDIDLMDDAPPELNEFPRLKDQQPEMYLNVKMSIFKYGVIQSLLLLKRSTGRYMIISGHNRKDICREIIEECQGNNDFDIKKYKYLPSKIYEEGELTDDQLKDYIDETNCMQRDISKLDQRTKLALLHRQMKNMKDRKYAGGKRIDELAKQMNLEKTTIYDSLAIVEKIIPPLQELYFNGSITRKAVLRFCYFDKVTQEWIWDTFGNEMKDLQIKLLKKSMSREEIEKVLSSEAEKKKRIYIDIPTKREKAIKSLLKAYMNIPVEQEQAVLDYLQGLVNDNKR